MRVNHPLSLVIILFVSNWFDILLRIRGMVHLDRFGTKLEQQFTKDNIVNMLEDEGFKDIVSQIKNHIGISSLSRE